MLTLSGTNTYSGPTVINAGTLRLAGNVLSAGTKIMPVGDSITYGQGIPATNAGYRGFLYNDLTASGNTMQFVGTTNGNPGSLPTSPVNQQYHDGWQGWTTGNILGTSPVGSSGNITTWLPALSGSGASPTIITMMFGTNDSGSGVSVLTATNNISQILSSRLHGRPQSVRFLLAELTPRLDGNNTWVNAYNADLIGLVAQFPDRPSGATTSRWST